MDLAFVFSNLNVSLWSSQPFGMKEEFSNTHTVISASWYHQHDFELRVLDFGKSSILDQGLYLF